MPEMRLGTSAARKESRRILIVDDHEDSARTMAVILGRRGHEVRTAFTGAEAISATAEFVPEWVLLDISLPDMDGFEVARRIREMPGLEGAFLVAVSGYYEESAIATAKAAGFNEYMMKPGNFALLFEWLER
jgi:CheY-like chemotaxis protein